MVCWVAGMLSSIILILAIAYTVIKLKVMFPGQEFHEKGRITCIALIFCFSITTKSLFEWDMYYRHLNTDHDAVMKMLLAQEIVMPIFWDVLPICTIFYLH